MISRKLLEISYGLYRRSGTTRTLYHLAAARLYRGAHMRVLVRDFQNRRFPISPSSIHCAEAMHWLCRGHEATGSRGVSCGYSFSWGWLPSYPEVTGYIIPTFFDHAALHPSSALKECRSRAITMANWLLDLQLQGGAYRAGLAWDGKKSLVSRVSLMDAEPSVFDTAQVMTGLVSAYEETTDETYLRAAVAAGEWIVGHQEENGSWVSFTLRNRPVAYHTFVAWPLLRLARVCDSRRLENAARKNLDWALDNQNNNGWFSHNSFFAGEFPVTHTIGYASQGLLESGVLLNDERYVTAALRTGEALLRVYSVRLDRRHGGHIQHLLAATFDETWKGKSSHSCLTGNAQTSVLWLRLYAVTRDARYLNAALQLNDAMKAMQDVRSRHPGIRGGVKGSHPIYGDYLPFSYPSWAAKFFADALMLEEKNLSELDC